MASAPQLSWLTLNHRLSPRGQELSPHHGPPFTTLDSIYRSFLSHPSMLLGAHRSKHSDICKDHPGPPPSSDGIKKRGPHAQLRLGVSQPGRSCHLMKPHVSFEALAPCQPRQRARRGKALATSEQLLSLAGMSQLSKGSICGRPGKAIWGRP